MSFETLLKHACAYMGEKLRFVNNKPTILKCSLLKTNSAST